MDPGTPRPLPAAWPTLLGGVLMGVVLATVFFSWASRPGSFGGAGVAGGEAVRTIRLGHGVDPGHPVALASERFAELVAERSGGKIKIEIYPNAQLGSQTEMLEQLQAGALDISTASAAQLESFVPEVSVFGLPYLFRDRGHFRRVLEGPIGDELAEAGRGVGLLGIAWFDSGSRSFYTVNRPVHTPDDLAGMKIRVMKSRTAMDLVTSMGAAPTPISYGELYTALQQGMVDGAENNPPSFLTARHYEVAKFLTLDEHSRVPDLFVAGTLSWDKLDEPTRALLLAAAAEASDYQWELFEQQSDAALAEVQAAGVTIIRPDVAAFAAKTAPMLEGFKGTPTGDLIDRIRAQP